MGGLLASGWIGRRIRGRFGEVPASDEARAWLFGVAYRVLANQRRSMLRRRRLFQRTAVGAQSHSGLADEPLIRSEEEAEAVEALSRLRAPDREILQLSLWEEVSPGEISEILNISRDAVDQRYSRAKKRLAQELNRQPSIKGRATQTTARKGGAA